MRGAIRRHRTGSGRNLSWLGPRNISLQLVEVALYALLATYLSPFSNTTFHSVNQVRVIGITFEFTRSRKRAKPAVASRVQRRVRPHGCSEALGRVACPKFMAMKKVDAERTSSFASGCDLAGQLSGSYPNSRSSCEQRQALAIFAAHWTAASRDGSSRTQKPPSNSLVCG